MSDLTNRAVFLSYASQDAGVAKKICEVLRATGVEVWFDQSELRGGDSWDAMIRKRIKECALFIPIISAHTEARSEGYFRLEWKLAVDRSHLMAEDTAFLFPLVIGDVPDALARVPDKFRAVQWTRLRLDETPVELAARVKKMLSGGSVAGVINSASMPALPTSGGGEASTPTTSAKPAWLPFVWVAVGLGFALFYALRSSWRPAQNPEAKPVPVAPAVIVAKPEAPASPKVDDKSVAVLAFTNLSEDKDNEYFSDGISEELLTVLQKTPGLRVAARTSAFSFKGKNATAQEIGRTLGVANVVDGSVQKSGTRVKVTAHLSRAATGEELWSESYTREIKDVFALQSELALAIVGELRGHLSGGENAAVVKAATKGGTTNPEAYQQYLQGKFFASRHAEKAVTDALVFYQRAVELDPSFALAWAGLARAHIWLCSFSDSMDRNGFESHLAKARAAMERALGLEPSLPEGLLARSEIQINFDYDWKDAAATQKAALALAPSDPEWLIAAGNLAVAVGQLKRGTELYQQAVMLDPVNATARVNLAYVYAQAKRLDEAKAEFPKVVELSPSSPWAHAGLGLAFVLEGKYDEAVAAAKDDAAEYARLTIEAVALFGAKKRPEADATLARLIANFGDTAAYQISEVYAFRGEKDHAFEWLERARVQRDGGLQELRSDPILDNLKQDPRWSDFLRKINLADDQLP